MEVYYETEGGVLEHSGAKYSDSASDFGRPNLIGSAIKIYALDDLVIFFPNLILSNSDRVSDLEADIEELQNESNDAYMLEGEIEDLQGELSSMDRENERLEDRIKELEEQLNAIE